MNPTDRLAGVLAPAPYREFSLQYMARIVEALPDQADGRGLPRILFTKNGGQWLAEMAATGCDALGVDWTTDLATARARVGDKVALQGNLDPCVLYASDDVIRDEVARVLASYGKGEGHVFNLGHGVHQFVQPERVKTLVDAVHELSAPYHA